MQEKTGFATGGGGNSLKEVVPGVASMTAVFANAYFVNAGGGEEQA